MSDEKDFGLMENTVSQYKENQIGSVTTIIQPVHENAPLSWMAELLNKNIHLEALPVERDGGVLDLITRQVVLEKSSKLLQNLKANPLSHELIQPPILDARESINKVVSDLLASNSDVLPEYFLVFTERRYYGFTTLSKLLVSAAQLRDQDLNRAREIQQLAVEKIFFTSSDWIRDKFVLMAYGVGGDYYQEACWKNENMALMACFDVSGKAVAGSLATSAIGGFFSALRQQPSFEITPVQFVYKINQFLMETLPLGTFTCGCFFFIPLDTKAPQGKNIQILNCGYNPVYFYYPRGNVLEGKALKPNLPPLGIDKMDIQEKQIFQLSIEKGLRLFTFSDGLTDLTDEFGKSYSEEQIREFLVNNLNHNPHDFLETLKKEIAQWQGRSPQADDITALAIQF